MKKRTYRSKNVNQINWQQLSQTFKGSELVLALDVAKEEQFGFLTDKQQAHTLFMKWQHPQETQTVLAGLKNLGCELDVVMESTGTYGDALRYQFSQSGFKVFQVSAKRVNDAQEVFDGVPSLHDAKSAWLIGRLHLDGISRLWRESNEEQRHMDALRQEYEMNTSQYSRNLNRLEAQIHRYWPELTRHIDLSTVTLEMLIRDYGTPQAVSQASEEVATRMRLVSKGSLNEQTIQAVITSAKQTQGQPCLNSEQGYLQALGAELTHSRTQANAVKKRIETAIQGQDRLILASQTIGKMSVAVLLSERLDPLDYPNATCYLKALGLNLKEKSSGQHKGQLHITKRGSSMARVYLYFAALRLIKSDEIVRTWYQNKVQRDGNIKLKGIIAVMRKLAKALWTVFRGHPFDASKLFRVAVTV